MFVHSLDVLLKMFLLANLKQQLDIYVFARMTLLLNKVEVAVIKIICCSLVCPPSTTGVWIFNDLCTTNCNYDACPAVPTIAGSPCSTLSQRCLGNGKVFVYVLDFKELYGSYLLSVIRPLQHHVLKCLPLPHLARQIVVKNAPTD
jgi:hypothetical protein